jgi:hypothetical protein
VSGVAFPLVELLLIELLDQRRFDWKLFFQIELAERPGQSVDLRLPMGISWKQITHGGTRIAARSGTQSFESAAKILYRNMK